MESTRLETLATEESTYFIYVAFKDATGAAVTPTAATFTLCDGDGTVINSRLDVTVPGTLAANMTIVLTGDDLAIGADEPDIVTRYVVLDWTYDGGGASDYAVRQQASFELARTIV